jgi:hypothetical protein
MSTVIAVMKHRDISAKEVVLTYSKEMNDEFKSDYLELIKYDGDLELDRIYKELIDKQLL